MIPAQPSLLVDQVALINARLNDITTQRVTYIAGVVSSNAATSFGANISQPDGTTITLTGIGASPHFMPPVGSTVTLALSGAQVVLVPAAIADNSVTPGSLSPNAPARPTGLTLATSSTVAADGTTHTVITASWTAPTLTLGGTGIVGTLTYVVQYRITGTTNWTGQPATGLAATLRATPGSGYDVQVSAVDRVGNVGAASTVSTITAGQKTVAPSTPSTPSVSNYLGQLKITWDGLLGGGAPGADFDYVEVHASSSSGFTPSNGTLVGQLSAAGSVFATATYTTTMYAKFVAVDTTGNRSTTSPQGSGATSQVVSADIFNGAVGSAQLASLAVTTAKINNLAVNDAQIGNMSVGKLTAGTMSVDVVMGGRFTTALSGARTEVNSLGFQKFDSGGNLIVSVTTTDTLFHGEFKTATSGRRIEIGAAGTTGTVQFYSSGGTYSFLTSVTEAGGSVEDIQMGVDLGGHAFWNRIFINDNAFMGYHAQNHQFNYTTSGTGSFVVNQYSSSSSFTTGRVTRLSIDNGSFLTRDMNGSTIQFAQTAGYSTANATISVRMQASSGAGSAITTTHDIASPTVEFRDQANTVWYPLTAGGFTTGSGAAGKAGITDYAGDPMVAVRAARPRNYQRNGPDNLPNPAARMELGLVAEEAPPEVVNSTSANGPGVDLYALCTLSLAAIQKLDARMTALEKKP